MMLILGLVLCSTSPILVSGNAMGVEDDSSLSYLDGSGVVIAVADTGVDLDHSCFRNSSDEVGIPGKATGRFCI